MQEDTSRSSNIGSISLVKEFQSWVVVLYGASRIPSVGEFRSHG